ncbi:MAG: diguanylate cyclase [Planctomycetes bacterium]|nr:diguanylate cyclase [Planctomycetota bacterium]
MEDKNFRVSYLALQAVHEGILISDADGRITMVNDAFLKITGYGKSEILGQTCAFIQGPGTDPRTRALIREARENREKFNGEILNYRKDGTTFWNDLSISPVLDRQGQLIHFIGITRDVTERKRLEDAREAALGLLQKITSQVPGVVYQFRLRPDGSYCFPFSSKALHDMYRLTPEEIREDGAKMFNVVHVDDRYGFMASIQKSALELTPWIQEYRVQFEDGAVRWLFGNSLPQKEADGSVLWHGFVTDITERKQMRERVSKLAFHDALTGLSNRNLFYDRLSQALAASNRSGHYGAVLFIDQDKFKPLNDMHGHAAGDALLIEMAQRLKRCVRESDTVARFGGDEFVVILDGFSDDQSESTDQARGVAEKICAALHEPYTLTIKQEGQPEETIEHLGTASIGVAMFLDKTDSQESILKRADMAMYQAKRQGGGMICFDKSRVLALDASVAQTAGA